MAEAGWRMGTLLGGGAAARGGGAALRIGDADLTKVNGRLNNHNQYPALSV